MLKHRSPRRSCVVYTHTCVLLPCGVWTVKASELRHCFDSITSPQYPHVLYGVHAKSESTLVRLCLFAFLNFVFPSFLSDCFSLCFVLSQVTELALKVIKTPRFRKGATELVVALGQSEEVSKVGSQVICTPFAGADSSTSNTSTITGDHDLDVKYTLTPSLFPPFKALVLDPPCVGGERL